MLTINAFITNLGKYNEGYLIGEWVNFPLSKEDEKRLFERIGISSEPDENGNYYEEYFITDFESELPIYDLYGEYVSIQTLNDIADKIDALSEHEQKTLLAYLEVYGGDVENAIDEIESGAYGLSEDINGEEYEARYVEEAYPELDFSKLGYLSSYIEIDYKAMFRDDAAFETSYGVLYEC